MAVDLIDNLEAGSSVRTKLNTAIGIVNTNENAQSALDAHKARSDNPHGTNWGNLEDVPDSFTPEAHTHPEAQISDLDRVRWAGAWIAGTYTLNDVVKQDEYTCVCVVASTTDKPVDPTLSPDWELLAVAETGGAVFIPDSFTGAGTEGYVPDPVTETGAFLKDDGTWAAVVTTPAYSDLTGEAATIPFTPQAAPTYNEGEIWYDSSAKTLSYYNDEADVTINVGQENVIRVRNNTGLTITNGQMVYVNGSQGANLPTVALAQADALATSRVLGMATHDIENASNGYVTTLGEVKDLDTSAFTAGDALFLDTAVAGGLTATRPTTGYAVVVGYCVIANVSIGEVKIIPGVTVQRADLWDGTDFTSTDIANWNTAFGWGDHGGSYLPIGGGTLTGSLTIDDGALGVYEYAAAADLSLRGAQGTQGTPTATQSADTFANLNFQGYGATDWVGAAASIKAIAAENFSDTVNGAELSFSITPALGSTLTEAMRISEEGFVGINTTAPVAELEVEGEIRVGYDAAGSTPRLVFEESAGAVTYTYNIDFNGAGGMRFFRENYDGSAGVVYLSILDGIVSGLYSDNGTPNPDGKLVVCTAAQYAGLTPDADTIYFVT